MVLAALLFLFVLFCGDRNVQLVKLLLCDVARSVSSPRASQLSLPPCGESLYAPQRLLSPKAQALSGAPHDGRFLFVLFCGDCNVQLVKLLLCDVARSVHHDVLGVFVHRERDDLADGVLAR